jgi:Ca2+/Na+ antiporter
MLSATALLILAAATHKRVTRWEGVGLLAAYVAFTAVRANIAV